MPGMEPAQKTANAIFKRNDFLREKGYIDSPRDLLHKRFQRPQLVEEAAAEADGAHDALASGRWLRRRRGLWARNIGQHVVWSTLHLFQ